jgi:hypothetical protein
MSSSGKITASDLLKWSTSISAATKKEDSTIDNPDLPREKIDPKWIDILLGKEDAVRMRDLMNDIIIDQTKSLEERIRAFDEFELVNFILKLLDK